MYIDISHFIYIHIIYHIYDPTVGALNADSPKRTFSKK